MCVSNKKLQKLVEPLAVRIKLSCVTITTCHSVCKENVAKNTLNLFVTLICLSLILVVANLEPLGVRI